MKIRLILLSICLLLSAGYQAKAFLWFKKKKKNKQLEQEIQINQEFLVQDSFKDDKGNFYEVKFAVYIPYPRTNVVVNFYYDEAKQAKISKLRWLTDQRIIRPVKSVIDINYVAEKLQVDMDPAAAYDRVIEKEHIVKHTFIFNYADLFPMKIARKEAHFLRAYWDADFKRDFRLDEKIYAADNHLFRPFNQPLTLNEKRDQDFYKKKFAEMEKDYKKDLRDVEEAEQKLYRLDEENQEDYLRNLQQNIDDQNKINLF